MVLSFRSSAKKELATFGTRLKVLIMVFLAFETFDLVKKVASSFLALDRKLKKAKNTIIRTFNLVPK